MPALGLAALLLSGGAPRGIGWAGALCSIEYGPLTNPSDSKEISITWRL